MISVESVEDSGPGPASCLNLYRRLAAGVTVVTARGDSGPTGMTASAVTSVSLDPPLLLVSLSQRSRTLAAITARRAFGVHLLRHDQREIARNFAAPSPARDSELQRLADRDVLGVPVLPDVLAWSVCLVEGRHAYGDHELVIGRVVATHACLGRPLVWHDRSFAELAS